MRTLLAHEWIEPIGGSENVLEQMRASLDPVRLVGLWNNASDRFPVGVEETWLARSPIRKSKAVSMPFHHSAWRSVKLHGIDRVVCSSHVFAHHLATRAARIGIPSYAYVHSPARYVWSPEVDARGTSPMARVGGPYFRTLDRRNASTDVKYACNSDYIRIRIADAWGQNAKVIHPSVDTQRLTSQPDWRAAISDPDEKALFDQIEGPFVLGASRLVEYKRLDAAISVGDALGLPVIIAGAGPDLDRLRTLAQTAGVPVTFFGRASDEALFALYQAASLFVFMAIEDFGIMPIEAMTLGTPVLANASGGAKEGVQAFSGGLATSDSDMLHNAARAIEMTPDSTAAERFSHQSFKSQVANWAGGNS